MSDLHLVFQQPSLSPKPAAITYQVAIGPDHAMAGNNDRYIISSIRAGYGPCGFGIAGLTCQVKITDGLAIGNSEQEVPDLFLKRSAFLVEDQFKYSSFSMEILYQLFNALN